MHVGAVSHQWDDKLMKKLDLAGFLAVLSLSVLTGCYRHDPAQMCSDPKTFAGLNKILAQHLDAPGLTADLMPSLVKYVGPRVDSFDAATNKASCTATIMIKRPGSSDKQQDINYAVQPSADNGGLVYTLEDPDHRGEHLSSVSVPTSTGPQPIAKPTPLVVPVPPESEPAEPPKPKTAVEMRYSAEFNACVK